MKAFDKSGVGGHSIGRDGRGLARWKRISIYGVLGCFVFLGVSYLLICLYIGSHVKAMSVEAMGEYPGDRVEAVIAYVESGRHSLKERNKAVWALGYLGGKRALPVIEKYVTGEACDHDRYLCQGELGKAIKLCEGGVNLCAWACR